MQESKLKHKHVTKQKDINQHLYHQVKVSQLKLTNDEQIALLDKLDRLLRRVTLASWLTTKTRSLLILEWQRRRTIMQDQLGYANVSKMGRDFNSAVAGHNDDVRERINKTFIDARNLTYEGNLREAARTFREINLHPSFLISNKHIETMLESHRPSTLRAIETIDKTRILLVRSVMKSASEVSHKRFKQISGEVLDFADLIQESLKK